jgi:hypothetical protein
MKRTLFATLLGVAIVPSISNGAGYLYISTYGAPPYNQVLWNPSTPVVGNLAVNDPNVQIQIWYGEGIISDPNLLTLGITEVIFPPANYDPGLGHGPGGYFWMPDSYQYPLQTLPDWDPGDYYTFQLRATGVAALGAVTGSSALWQERGAITSTMQSRFSDTVPQLVISLVPEPSMFALAGMGSGLLLVFRRRT